MTRDDIVKMAHEAGLVMPTAGATENQWKALEIFADLVCEECAKLCDDEMDWGIISPQIATGAANCAKAIRARGQA